MTLYGEKRGMAHPLKAFSRNTDLFQIWDFNLWRFSNKVGPFPISKQIVSIKGGECEIPECLHRNNWSGLFICVAETAIKLACCQQVVFVQVLLLDYVLRYGDMLWSCCCWMICCCNFVMRFLLKCNVLSKIQGAAFVLLYYCYFFGAVEDQLVNINIFIAVHALLLWRQEGN